jgi:carbon storage regulator
MLLLTRKAGDQIVIDGRIIVKVIDIQGGRVQLGIEAPKDVKIEGREDRLARPRARPRAATVAL